MTTVARVKKDGSLLLKNDINERLPVVTDGLVAYYPLDSKAGAIDVVNGAGTVQNVESNMNIIDALNLDWKTPAFWGGAGVWDEAEQAMRFASSGAEQAYSTILIPIDTTKHWHMTFDAKRDVGGNGVFYAGTVSLDVNKNVLPGHPGTYDYFVECAAATPTVWTHYDNNIIGGAGRTGESSDQGNFAVWHTGTKYAKLLLLCDYGGTIGPTWIKNLRFYTTDADTSNVVITEEGIAVQEATTNLNLNPLIPSFNNWGGFSGTSKAFVAPNGHVGVILQAFTNGGCRWYYANSIVISPNTTYTISCKIKFSDLSKVHANFFYIRQYNSSWTQLSEYGVFNPANIVEMDNGYYFAWGVFTTVSNAAYLNVQGYEYTGGQTISCYDTQVEQRSFATAFVNGSAGSSEIAIPEIVKSSLTTTWSVNLKAKFLDLVGESHALFDFRWSGRIPVLFMVYNGNLGVYYLDGTDTNTGYLPSAPVTNLDEWKTYTLTYNGTTLKGYVDGVLLLSVDTTLGSLNNNIARLGWDLGSNPPVSNVILKNFAIYNKTLSASEIMQLAGEAFKVDSSKASTPLLIENPVIPLDGFYFPLASDALDITKTISPSEANNLAYEDGAVWVGTETTNGYNISFQPWSNNGGYNTYLGLTGPNNTPRWLFTKTGTGYQWNGWQGNYGTSFVTTNGTPFTLSFYSRKDTLAQGWGIGFYTLDGSRGVSTGTSGAFNTTGFFKKSYGTVTFTEDTPSGAIIGDGPSWGYSTSAGTIEVAGIMWEMGKLFPSPYCIGTRGDSSLEYNLNSSIGLDWGGNWTICYWKKPIATRSFNFVGYNIESLGCNGNSVGGGYIWWGKHPGSDTISNATPLTFVPADYFNDWQFVTLVKLGTTLTIKTQLKTGTVYVRTAEYGGYMPSNYFVTQYGYDLRLGGWDNGNPCNTYFRDLIVVKRALSDAELTNIYKQFSIYKTNVNTQYLIEEGI